MNTNQWITDRLPNKEDADYNGYVWGSFGCLCCWDLVQNGDAWMKTNRPKPYVIPERFVVKYFDNYGTWGVKDTHSIEPGLPNRFKTREAAERIAAIFEELSP